MANLPYFRWFPADAENDERYVAMTDQELGFYHRCLNRAWANGGLPADLDMLARVMRVSREYLDLVWPVVSSSWQLVDGRLTNNRQELERQFANSRSERLANAGRAGGKRSARVKHELKQQLEHEHSISLSDDVIRAYETETVFSISNNPDTEEADLSLLDRFDEFKAACEKAGIAGSSVDWMKAGCEWRVLDGFQQAVALKGIADRVAAGEYPSNFVPLPYNYLKQRIWERPVKSPVQQARKLTGLDIAMGRQ